MLERVVGARIEDPSLDLWLLVPADGVSFSRNVRDVYHGSTTFGNQTGRSR